MNTLHENPTIITKEPLPVPGVQLVEAQREKRRKYRRGARREKAALLPCIFSLAVFRAAPKLTEHLEEAPMIIIARS